MMLKMIQMKNNLRIPFKLIYFSTCRALQAVMHSRHLLHADRMGGPGKWAGKVARIHGVGCAFLGPGAQCADDCC